MFKGIDIDAYVLQILVCSFAVKNNLQYYHYIQNLYFWIIPYKIFAITIAAWENPSSWDSTTMVHLSAYRICPCDHYLWIPKFLPKVQQITSWEWRHEWALLGGFLFFNISTIIWFEHIQLLFDMFNHVTGCSNVIPTALNWNHRSDFDGRCSAVRGRKECTSSCQNVAATTLCGWYVDHMSSRNCCINWCEDFAAFYVSDVFQCSQ